MGGMGAFPTVASRVDRGTRIREEMWFFGESAPILGFLHRPESEPRGGLLVCSPIGAELDKNYRREVLLGRGLAAAGIAVMRFHYRGIGNGGGHPEDTTFDTMTEDAVRAAAELATRTGLDAPAVLGTRLGALVAARIAEELDSAQLGLWEPVTDGDAYIRELSRTAVIRRLAQSTENGRPQGLATAVREAGHADVVGYTLHQALIESIAGRRLADTPVHSGRQVLLVQMEGGDALRRSLSELAAAWEEAGALVATHLARGSEVWWFASEHFEQEERRPISRDVVDHTTRWFAESVGSEVMA